MHMRRIIAIWQKINTTRQSKMADSSHEIITFLNNVPSDIEQARRAMFSNNSHVLEHWHMRLENSNNFISILINEMQQQLEGNLDEVNLRSLRSIQREVRDVYQGIDMLLVEGHGAVEGMQNHCCHSLHLRCSLTHLLTTQSSPSFVGTLGY